MQLSCQLDLTSAQGLGFVLAGIGYGVGLLFSGAPSYEARRWSGELISYSLVTAGFLALLTALGKTVSWVSDIVFKEVKGLGFSPSACPGVLEVYSHLGQKAVMMLATIAGIGIATAIIPIVGVALANVLSVVASFPAMVLTGIILISYTLLAFLAVFGVFAVALVPFVLLCAILTEFC